MAGRTRYWVKYYANLDSDCLRLKHAVWRGHESVVVDMLARRACLHEVYHYWRLNRSPVILSLLLTASGDSAFWSTPGLSARDVEAYVATRAHIKLIAFGHVLGIDANASQEALEVMLRYCDWSGEYYCASTVIECALAAGRCDIAIRLYDATSQDARRCLHCEPVLKALKELQQWRALDANLRSALDIRHSLVLACKERYT